MAEQDKPDPLSESQSSEKEKKDEVAQSTKHANLAENDKGTLAEPSAEDTPKAARSSLFDFFFKDHINGEDLKALFKCTLASWIMFVLILISRSAPFEAPNERRC
jgi:hypothetical protein